MPKSARKALRMLTRSLLFVSGAFLAACSSSTSHTALPDHCTRTDRVGTYYATFSTQGGDCGPQNNGLVNLGGGTAPGGGPAKDPSGCTINSERWSEGDCKLERDVTCPNGAHAIAVTRSQNADSSELSGTLTITTSTCSGTYAIDAIRQ